MSVWVVVVSGHAALLWLICLMGPAPRRMAEQGADAGLSLGVISISLQRSDTPPAHHQLNRKPISPATPQIAPATSQTLQPHLAPAPQFVWITDPRASPDPDPSPARLAALVAQSQAAPPIDPKAAAVETPPTNNPVQTGGSGPGAKCRLEAALQDLQQSDQVRAALTRVPREARSVANAIMLWNGQWMDDAALGGQGSIVPIRAAIIVDILAASPECRNETIHGPVFIQFAEGKQTTILVIGSANWRWADLASTSPFQS